MTEHHSGYLYAQNGALLISQHPARTPECRD